MNILYSAHATATGGRDGRAKSSDGVLDIRLAVPKEMGGPGGDATNPEQLFAAGYSACYLGALKFVGGREKIAVTSEATVSGTVGIGKTETGFALKVDLAVHLPGVSAADAAKLIAAAHIVCPYSNATRGNVEVSTTVV